MTATKQIDQPTALSLLHALKLALRYLEHPNVQAMPFARSAKSVAEHVVRPAIAKAEGQ